MNRQKELRSLYRDFRASIDTIRKMSPSRAPSGHEEEEEVEAFIVDDVNGEVELLIGEIEILQSETDEIVALINKPKFAKYARVQSIKKQLHYLQTVNGNLRTRAEALLDVE
jgi:prefoldin subunit 5